MEAQINVLGKTAQDIKEGLERLALCTNWIEKLGNSWYTWREDLHQNL